MLSENPHHASRPIRVRHVRGRGLAVPVAVSLLLVGAGCSDDEGGGEEEAGTFCTEAQEAMAEVGSDLDLEGLGEAWRGIEAEIPESIADDWDLVLERWDELAEAPADTGLDTSLPDAGGEPESAEEADGSGESESESESDAETGDGNGNPDPEEAEAEADRGLELQLAWRSVRSYFRDLCDMDMP